MARRGRRRVQRVVRRPRRRRKGAANIPADLFITGHMRISPANTVSFGLGSLPKGCTPPFRILSVDVTFAAVDVATANTERYGPVLLQVRQQGYLPSTTKALDGETIKACAPIMATGALPKRLRFRPRRIVYPSHYAGSACIAIDCLCFKEGSEIGADMHYKISFQKVKTFEAESCPSYTITPYCNDKRTFVEPINCESGASTPCGFTALSIN